MSVGCILLSCEKAAQLERAMGEGKAELGRRSLEEDTKAITHVSAREVTK